jgi:hypothetical protein
MAIRTLFSDGIMAGSLIRVRMPASLNT